MCCCSCMVSPLWTGAPAAYVLGQRAAQAAGLDSQSVTLAQHASLVIGIYFRHGEPFQRCSWLSVLHPF